MASHWIMEENTAQSGRPGARLTVVCGPAVMKIRFSFPAVRPGRQHHPGHSSIRGRDPPALNSPAKSSIALPVTGLVSQLKDFRHRPRFLRLCLHCTSAPSSCSLRLCVFSPSVYYVEEIRYRPAHFKVTRNQSDKNHLFGIF